MAATAHAHRSGTTRRVALQAGTVGLLSMSDVFTLRSQGAASPSQEKSVIFVFLTGGLSHQDSFDLKPDAPASVRGEFRPIATRSSGIQIGEHLPLLAQRSDRFALVRSMTTGSNGHEEACHMLLTGRMDFPVGFNLSKVPSLNEWPSLAALVTQAPLSQTTRSRKALPPAAVLPQPSINETGKVRPGQFAGRLGPDRDSWHLDIAAPCALGNGACPHCFRFDGAPFQHGSKSVFAMPNLTLTESVAGRFASRMGLLSDVERQLVALDQEAEVAQYSRQRQTAISVLTSPDVRAAFDVEQAEPRLLERYGRNKFGLSLLMAARLSAAGVNLVQVNLGKNSTWDTHRRNFVNLKDNLLPYLDRAVAALLDDLAERGLLDSTLVVVTGEFGRTPKINADAGRDHWGPVMTSLFAGGGVRGGQVIGATDKIAAYPTSEPFTPENLAATIFQTLGISSTAHWHDVDGRPHQLYQKTAIRGLMA